MWEYFVSTTRVSPASELQRLQQKEHFDANMSKFLF